MEKKVSKCFMKLLGFAGSLLLTIFAGVFGLMTIAALVGVIITPTIFSFMGCIASGFIAWVMWSVRKDVLV